MKGKPLIVSKFEITPEMLEAGIAVHDRYDRDYDPTGQVVAEVFEAMMEKAPKLSLRASSGPRSSDVFEPVVFLSPRAKWAISALC